MHTAETAVARPGDDVGGRDRGFDPKDFLLASFGGAGGLHVCAIADAMQMRRAIVPAYGGVLSALGMLVVQTITNFFIPSGSGQAFVTMPIMSPLATLTGVPQQTAVLAFQFGDGFTNMIVPTSALVMGALALGKIPYGAWARFIGPLLVKLFALAAAFLVLTIYIGDYVGLNP